MPPILVYSARMKALILAAAILLGDSNPFIEGKYHGADLPERAIVLTVDDGPSDPADEVLDFVNAEKIPPTFLLIGRNIKDARTLERMKASGHLVANHTFTHP